MDGGGEGRRRAPEMSVLHEVFRRGWPAVSSSMPSRVKREVEQYLRCGDLRYGFVEVSCEVCKEARLVAFSCKGRGFCPSCTTRRAIDTGAQLESVLPHVAHRQWTLSLPFSLRFQVVKRPELLKRIEVCLVRAIWRWQRREARRLGVEGPLRGGGVCFWQWFGSSLQLTPHLHLLVPEAQWLGSGESVLLGPPSDDDVTAVLHRVLRQAQRDWGDEGVSWADDEYEAIQQQAIQQRLPLPESGTQRRRRLAVAHGFSLHADTAVHANDRQGLERLCRYGARGPVCESRLRRLDDGRYEYTPKKGVTFTLTAEALVRRLVALVPPARLHLTSFHGVLAPNASLRPLATRQPEAEAAPGPRAKVPPLEKDEAAPRLGHPPPAHLRHRRVAVPLRWAPYHSRVALHPRRRRAETDCPWHSRALAHSPAGHRASPTDPRRLKDSPGPYRLRPSSRHRCVDVAAPTVTAA